MEIVKLYETASTDGYTRKGENLYFIEEDIAKLAGKDKHGNYAVNPICHLGIKYSNDEYLLLASDKPVALANSETARQKLKKNALKKLTKEEKELLGLQDSETQEINQ